MSHRSIFATAQLVLLAVLTLFAAPGEAWATDLDFQMEIQWGDGVDPYDVEAEVQLLDGAGVPVTGWFAMTPNSQATLYTLTIEDVPTSAVTARFRWNNPDDDVLWFGMDIVVEANANPMLAEPVLNWAGLTINDVLATRQ